MDWRTNKRLVLRLPRIASSRPSTEPTSMDDKKEEQSTRKRRLSRKEQKARKKKQPPAELHRTNEERQQDQEADVALPVPTKEEVENSYSPTPIPTLEDMRQRHKEPSLGAWFPKAVILKSKIHYTNADVRRFEKEGRKDAPKASILLFYQYVTDPRWSASRVDMLIAYLIGIAKTRSNLGGRIRVAQEGVNVTLSAIDDPANNRSAALTLRHFAMDLKHFDPQAFATTDFKYIDHVQADRHFKDFKVFPVQELVFYGFSNGNGNKTEDPAPLHKTGVHLPPRDFHKMLQGDSSETVVIDVRNHYEAAIGRFDGQEHQQNTEQEPQKGETASTTQAKASGAEYIDPKMRKSTDFSKWLHKEETKEKLKDKNVLLFCTGGVRCERASAFLKNSYGTDHVKGVFQLQGGVEGYLKEFPSGGLWRGKNFVFDKREACGAGSRDGDGGVVSKKGKSSNHGIETHCCLCALPWDRYVGKKKCSTCGVPVLMCDACMSNKKKQKEELARCPLCVEENVTVRAEEIEWTNNGVDISKAKAGSSSKSKLQTATKKKAAPSVLKWGGGHAANKKDRRRFKNTPCRFGSECVRKDCFFSHPPKNSKGKEQS